jgi:hypothetical protein
MNREAKDSLTSVENGNDYTHHEKMNNADCHISCLCFSYVLLKNYIYFYNASKPEHIHCCKKMFKLPVRVKDAVCLQPVQ